MARTTTNFAELLNPTEQCLIEGRFFQEFDAHPDTRLENTNNGQCFDNLISADLLRSCLRQAGGMTGLGSGANDN